MHQMRITMNVFFKYFLTPQILVLMDYIQCSEQKSFGFNNLFTVIVNKQKKRVVVIKARNNTKSFRALLIHLFHYTQSITDPLIVRETHDNC